MDVRMPDGTIVQNVPDGITKAELVQKLHANGHDVGGMTMPASQPESKPDTFLGMDTGKLDAVAQFAKDAGGGIARSGMGLVSNLMRPIDAITGANGPTLSSLITGKPAISANDKRMAKVDQRFRKDYGVNPDSAAFQATKLGGDIALTAPIGGALGAGVKAVSKAPAVTALANALASGGMTTGNNLVNATRAARALDMGTRVAGGAITGGAMSGAIDPNSAGTGALIGGALPPALNIAGTVGRAVNRVISGPTVAEPVRNAVEAARGAGYVIPPSQAKPTLLNRALEGFSGKITTAQNASARNQPVTQAIIAKELGLPAGTPVSLDALKAVRTQAGNAYDAIGSAGTINTTPAYYAALDKITASAKQAAAGFPNAKPNPLIAEIESLKTPQFDASSAVAKIKELRSSADAAYASGNKDLGKALKDGSSALEDAIDDHLTAIGAPKTILDGFRNARQLIAKTYSVEKAMNATTGNVDAVKLGQQLAKGKPLSGGIRDAAAFGQQFPKAAQSIEKMGSLPQVSPLDFGALGTISALTSNPLLMAGVLARPAARGAVLSNLVQNGLAKPQGQNALGALLMNQRAQHPGLLDLENALYRSVPVMATSANR